MFYHRSLSGIWCRQATLGVWSLSDQVVSSARSDNFHVFDLKILHCVPADDLEFSHTDDNMRV